MESKALMPGIGYDATLCPVCTERGKVYGRNSDCAENWLIRRRRCEKCGARWSTVELYITGKRSGTAPHGAMNLRMLALEVDALDQGEIGPQVTVAMEGESHDE